jgi:hypothetical protein
MSDFSETSVLDVLRDMLETEAIFFRSIRFLEGTTRNHLVAAQLRNTNLMVNLLQVYQRASAETTTMVMNIPINFRDASGSFFESVPVIPTREQITAAIETHIGVTNTVCSICQEGVTCASRIRQCGHCFHGSCIDQWFSMNPRCPVCRHDIRDGLSANPPSVHNEDRSLHSDDEEGVGMGI